ncbi:MAG: hypothetical protein HUJ80_00130 [Firmicutes bacterium]|nr:hypothetical protein [Bacillota bacterium]
MKFLVVGAGAIGGVIGGLLTKGGCDVTLLDVAEDHVLAMQQHGLKLIMPDGSEEVISVKAQTVEEYLKSCPGPVECLLLCVKGQFTEAALEPFLPAMDENSFVVSVQNGLNEYTIEKLIGRERTVSGFVNIFSDYMEPGVINYGGKGALVLGEMDGSMTGRMKLLEQELKGLDHLELSDNVLGYLWAKLGYAVILLATTLTNETMADVIDDPRYRIMLMDLASETYQVAQAEGFELPQFDDFDPADAYPREGRDLDKLHRQLDVHVQRLRSYTKVHSGFWRDIVVRKRRSEVSVFELPVRECAQKHGIPIPLTARCFEMFRQLEAGERPFTTDNLDELVLLDRQIYARR